MTTASLGDRLEAARRRAFVGRATELALVARMLDGREPGTVLYIHGPGGVGKSTLLRQIGWQAEAAGRRVERLDGRELEPGPRGAAADVLLVDEVDAIAGRRENVLEGLLGSLSVDAVAVLAGREPPPTAWRTDPGWRAILNTVRLENLGADEGRALLRLRGVPEAAHDGALAFTHGHPLALALLADVVAQSAGDEPVAATPEVLTVLLDSLVGSVPSEAHLAALEACSQVAVTTEPLLAALLGVTDARALFDWLRELSIVDFAARGIYPHDVAREALARELSWRHPEAHDRLHRRARAFYERQLAGADPATARRVLFDFAFLHRDSPVIGPFLRHVTPGRGDADGLSTGPATAAELPRLLAMLAEHEGAESAGHAAHWARAQPGAVTAVRDAEDVPVGVIVAPALDRATAAERAADPVAAAAWAHAQQSPAAPDETVLLVRHWSDALLHQAVSPVQTHVLLHLMRRYLTTPGLAQVYLRHADPDLWTPAMAYADFQRVPGEHGLFVHDWRAVPPIAWMARLAGRETETDPLAGAEPTPEPDLGEAAFAEAVRAALRDVTRPDRLRGS
ncbi:MAG TPA: hypothetical protein VFY38_13675, partial [Pseudonocardia sp.]|nr:hypothetical protein [Pseudonocardia sp.]